MNNKMNKISFIIPAYNCEKTLKQSVLSIVETNFKKGDELIIVNDCSTDSTLRVINALKKKYEFIISVSNDSNKGGSYTRNRAIKESKNELIFCLDSDNVLCENSIDELKNFLIDNKLDVASFGEVWYFQKFGQVTHKWIFRKDLQNVADCLAGPIWPGASGNYLYTKKSWVKVGGYPEEAGALDSWGFGFRLVATGFKMTSLPNTFYWHRYGHESYWIRDSKKDGLSAKKYKIIKPFLDKFSKDTIKDIKKNKNKLFDVKFNPKTRENIKGESGIKVVPLKNKSIAYFKRKIKNTVFFKYAKYCKKYYNFKKLTNQIDSRFLFKWSDRYPCLNDNTNKTSFDRHCIYHPAWAARILKEDNPKVHTDISSTLHFCSIVSAFIPVDFYDYRPAELNLKGLKSSHADLLNLPFEDDSVESLSCMHTIEHVGLGRYGDPIDPEGDLKAIKELKRVLAVGGNLLFVVPIGKPRVMFNAHRIYSYDQIIKYFSDLKLMDFSLIPDNEKDGGIVQNPSDKLLNKQKYACGCFWFKKIK